MIIYKPTGEVFQNRKEARIKLGSAYYNRLEREKTDLIFIPQFATNEICENTPNTTETKRQY